MARVLFTADLHGNELQYKKLIDYARFSEADYVIIGGDLAPKGLPEELYISSQRDFLEKRLPLLLSPLKERNPAARIFLMMGNDDCACNLDVMKTAEGKIYDIIHQKRMSLKEGFDIVGYGIVPITRFDIKDWEKFDLSEPAQSSASDYLLRKAWNYDLKGLITKQGAWQEFIFDTDTEKKDSIQLDLRSETFTHKPSKTLYVMHSPPNNTSLDKILSNHYGMICPVSVGSFAIKEFIEKHQPYATLHGHIHESATITGRFKEKIGETISLTAGNYNTSNTLSVIEFNLENVAAAQRKKL